MRSGSARSSAEPPVSGGGQTALARLDRLKLRGGIPISFACQLVQTGSCRRKFRRLKIEAAIDRLGTRGQFVKSFLPMTLRQPLARLLAHILNGVGEHIASQASQRDATRRDSVRAAEQQQVFDRELG